MTVSYIMWKQNIHTSPRRVFSRRPFTIRAEASLSRVTSLQLIMGVLMALAALIISLMRGTPRVTFIDATPAKWKVFNVIWVPGSPMDWAPTAPTVEPATCPCERLYDNHWESPYLVRSGLWRTLPNRHEGMSSVEFPSPSFCFPRS